MKLSTHMKQIGIIVWSASMNRRSWINEARAQGYIVVDYGDHARLYK